MLGWASQSGSLPDGKENSCNFYVDMIWNSLFWFLEFLEFMDRSGFEGLEPSAWEVPQHLGEGPVASARVFALFCVSTCHGGFYLKNWFPK